MRRPYLSVRLALVLSGVGRMDRFLYCLRCDVQCTKIIPGFTGKYGAMCPECGNLTAFYMKVGEVCASKTLKESEELCT